MTEPCPRHCRSRSSFEGRCFRGRGHLQAGGGLGARAVVALFAALVLAGCESFAPEQRPISAGHLESSPPVAPVSADEIPPPVTTSSASFLPPPTPKVPEETYTVVVNKVPVDELLFALARDAALNIDVHPDVTGSITLNAIDQTLTQILDRISRQLPVRYEERNATLTVMPDSPFMRSYVLDYVNLTRSAESEIGSSTDVASAGVGDGGGGGNASDQSVSATSASDLWTTVEANIRGILDVDDGSRDVVLSRESGLIVVRATSGQHAAVEDYLARTRTSVTRQVLIEATVVEVNLSDRFQAGIDWQLFTRQASVGGAGVSFGTALGSAFSAGGAGVGLVLSGRDAPVGDAERNIEFSLDLLKEYGDIRVLSSPKLLTLNNQPAVLKVVDNVIFFDVDVDVQRQEIVNNVIREPLVTVDSDIRSVAVGLVMTVTPQVDANGAVTMVVRPSITRVIDTVPDPAVAVAIAQIPNAGVAGLVPNEIPVVQVRETETVLRIGTRQTAVIGGLMQDRTASNDDDVPGAADVPGVGELFKSRDRQQAKSELVVFLRPTVINTPDIRADFAQFRRYLPENLRSTAIGRTPALDVPVDEPEPALSPTSTE